LIRVDRHAAPLLAVLRNRLSQWKQTAAVGVVGSSGPQGIDGGLHGLRRRVEVRLADAELHDGRAPTSHRHPSLHDLHGQERLDLLRALCEHGDRLYVANCPRSSHF
jgi:hypothetical protein